MKMTRTAFLGVLGVIPAALFAKPASAPKKLISREAIIAARAYFVGRGYEPTPSGYYIVEYNPETHEIEQTNVPIKTGENAAAWKNVVSGCRVQHSSQKEPRLIGSYNGEQLTGTLKTVEALVRRYDRH